jgi:uncharacterized protein (TIGR02217 family)
MTSFEEIQFPSDISYGAVGGPVYSTDIVTTFSGHEQRNSNWQNARAKYNVASGVKTESQWQALIAFFRARRGKAVGFRFKDWGDYKAINQQIGVGNGSNKIFQLSKIYSSGSAAVARDIKKPVSGTVKIYVNSVLQASPAINHATGVVTLATAPTNGAIVTADFEFDVPVRFDTDELSLSLDSYDAANWSSIPLIEVRV